MAMNRFIDITDFSREGLREALNLVSFIKDNSDVYKSELEGRTLISAFFDEDRNSELCFKSAATRMGGKTFDFIPAKGECLKDAVMTMSASGDIIVMHHPQKGAARAASMYAKIPVINAGDGGRACPVTTLSDFTSVWLTKKHVSNLKVGFLGDFSNNAPVRGLLQCLNIYNGNEFFFISANGKPVSDDFINIMDRRDKPFVVLDNLFAILPELDVLYMTTVTKDSFDSEIMYNARKHNFILDEKLLLTAKNDLAVLHNFPRGEELDISVDGNSRARYFEQMDYNVNAAMAMLLKVVTNRTGRLIKPSFEEATHDKVCGRPDCITSTESYLPGLFHETPDGKLICKYCNHVFDKD